MPELSLPDALYSSWREPYLATLDNCAYVRYLVAEKGWTAEVRKEGKARFEALIAGELCTDLDRRFVTT